MVSIYESVSQVKQRRSGIHGPLLEPLASFSVLLKEEAWIHNARRAVYSRENVNANPLVAMLRTQERTT